MNVDGVGRVNVGLARAGVQMRCVAMGLTTIIAPREWAENEEKAPEKPELSELSEAMKIVMRMMRFVKVI